MSRARRPSPATLNTAAGAKPVGESALRQLLTCSTLKEVWFRARVALAACLSASTAQLPRARNRALLGTLEPNGCALSPHMSKWKYANKSFVWPGFHFLGFYATKGFGQRCYCLAAGYRHALIYLTLKMTMLIHR